MSRQRKVMVFYGKKYEGEWPPNDASECVLWFSQKLQTIPEQYWKTATIDIGAEECCDSSPYIEIFYVRPETDEEKIVREKEEIQNQECRIQIELNRLVRLQERQKKESTS